MPAFSAVPEIIIIRTTLHYSVNIVISSCWCCSSEDDRMFNYKRSNIPQVSRGWSSCCRGTGHRTSHTDLPSQKGFGTVACLLLAPPWLSLEKMWNNKVYSQFTSHYMSNRNQYRSTVNGQRKPKGVKGTSLLTLGILSGLTEDVDDPHCPFIYQLLCPCLSITTGAT